MRSNRALEALADPTRRTVFERLRRGPLPVGHLAAGLDVSRPAVSQHLRVLEDAGLVRARQEGTRRIYAIELQGLEELKSWLDGFWDDVLAGFQAEAERGLPGPTIRRSAKARPKPKSPPRTRKRRPRHG
jgi:DNA-binding transcriptional ArsR family regulator